MNGRVAKKLRKKANELLPSALETTGAQKNQLTPEQEQHIADVMRHDINKGLKKEHYGKANNK